MRGTHPIDATDPLGLKCTVFRIVKTPYYSDGTTRTKTLGYGAECTADIEDQGGNGGADPGDEPPSERERKRLEGITRGGYLSEEASSVFDQMLGEGRVLMGRRGAGAAIAYADWSTPPNIIFGPGRFGAVQSFSSHQVARVIAHEVGHVLQRDEWFSRMEFALGQTRPRHHLYPMYVMARGIAEQDARDYAERNIIQTPSKAPRCEY